MKTINLHFAAAVLTVLISAGLTACVSNGSQGDFEVKGSLPGDVLYRAETADDPAQASFVRELNRRLRILGKYGENSDSVYSIRVYSAEMEMTGESIGAAFISRDYEMSVTAAILDPGGRSIVYVSSILRHQYSRLHTAVDDPNTVMDQWDRDFPGWAAARLIEKLYS